MTISKRLLTLIAAAAISASAFAQTAAPTPAAHNWTEEQLVTATVHQAWLLADKNEDTFFDIIQQLAEISAKNRNVTLPNDAAVGKRAGAYIKKQAKADHDQLLYAIVDRSVRMTGKPAAGQ